MSRDVFTELGRPYCYISCVEFDKPRQLLQAIVHCVKVVDCPTDRLLMHARGCPASSTSLLLITGKEAEGSGRLQQREQERATCGLPRAAAGCAHVPTLHPS